MSGENVLKKCKGFFCSKTSDCARYSSNDIDEFFTTPPYSYDKGVFSCSSFIDKHKKTFNDPSVDYLKSIFGMFD